MKVKFWCNSGANIHSCRDEIMDTDADLGFSDEDWNEMTDNEKYEEALQWAWESLEIGYTEL